LIITLIFVFEFINLMILTTFSMIIFVLKNSQTYHCFFLFYVMNRNLIELTWNLMTFSLKRILKKIFWTSEIKTMISIKEKMIWTFLNLIKNSFSFISFLQMSMIVRMMILKQSKRKRALFRRRKFDVLIRFI
jgi:hypothetical protein